MKTNKIIQEQKDFIERMEKVVNEKFKGKTKNDANKWISEWYQVYEMIRMNDDIWENWEGK